MCVAACLIPSLTTSGCDKATVLVTHPSPRASPHVWCATAVHIRCGLSFYSASLTRRHEGNLRVPLQNSLHTRMLPRPGNQTITNHHLAHCQTYQKPPYASMQCIIYKVCQSPYPSRKPRCLKCVYICLFTKLS